VLTEAQFEQSLITLQASVIILHIITDSGLCQHLHTYM